MAQMNLFVLGQDGEVRRAGWRCRMRPPAAPRLRSALLLMCVDPVHDGKPCARNVIAGRVESDR
jgi:hypothetical protein